jgi:hypothetical protein
MNWIYFNIFYSLMQSFQLWICIPIPREGQLGVRKKLDLPSLIIWEKQVKITTRHYFTYTKKVTIKKKPA